MTDQITSSVDSYAKILDELEARTLANTTAMLRTALDRVLGDLKRHYAAYLNAVGPSDLDPEGNPIRAPGAYSSAEASTKYRAILRDAQQFLPPEEIAGWQRQFTTDLVEALAVGGEAAAALQGIVTGASATFAGANPLAIRAAVQTATAFMQGESARFRDQIVSQIRARISSVDEQGRPVSVCMGVQDRTTMRSARILVRGEIDQQAQEVPRGFVQVLGNLPKQLSPKSSGRLELAQWMVSKDNPLAARVMVNRIWQHLIGKGIVREPDNFGVSGPAPTHRDLLDYLAIDFMDNGWSIKHMIRSIATSRVYRISSAYDPERFEADPENLWIARANPKRLGAEAIRDSMLTASGSINLKPAKSSMFASFGPAVMGPNGPQNIPLIFAPNAINDDRAANLRRLLGGGMRNPTINQMEVANYHRSVYLPVGRNVLPRALDVFDFADPNSVTGTREVSNTAAQALYMMNNPFVLELSDAFARRVMQSTKDPQGRVDRAFQLAYGRSASTDEVNASLRFLRRAKESQDQVPADEALFKAWSQLCQALIAAAEFRIVN